MIRGARVGVLAQAQEHRPREEEPADCPGLLDSQPGEAVPAQPETSRPSLVLGCYMPAQE
jgi:hypothetical protein